MSAPSHVRVISLIMAISVMVGAGLMLEYSNHPPVPNTELTASDRTEAPPLPRQSIQREPTASAPVTQPAATIRSRQMYKCAQNGKVTFGDQPCTASQQAIVVPTESPPVVAPVQQETTLDRMRRQLAQMEADRHQREQQFDQEMAARRQPVTIAPDKTTRCAQIDQEISHIDSLLRQPHTAQWGDYWAEQRKRLYDERFDLHC